MNKWWEKVSSSFQIIFFLYLLRVSFILINSNFTRNKSTCEYKFYFNFLIQSIQRKSSDAVWNCKRQKDVWRLFRSSAANKSPGTALQDIFQHDQWKRRDRLTGGGIGIERRPISGRGRGGAWRTSWLKALLLQRQLAELGRRFGARLAQWKC